MCEEGKKRNTLLVVKRVGRGGKTRGRGGGEKRKREGEGEGTKD